MSISELVLIFAFGLILFGPDELPKIARTIGKMIYEIKQAATDIQTEVRKSVLEQPTKPMPNVSKADGHGQEQEINPAEQKE